MSSSSETKNTLENYLIPLKDIRSATNDFDFKNQIGRGGFGLVYKGQLSERWGNCTAAIKRRDQDGCQGKHEFETELQMVSRFQHENVISFIGYCDEGEEMIIVYEYAINGSLDQHLQDIDRRRCLSWAQRLIICMGVAQGLKYLHSGLGDDYRIIHRDMKTSNILLDQNMEAKISDFGLSRSGPRNQPLTDVHTSVAGTSLYIDPLYLESGILTKKSDVYSLGVVLFEMLCGMMVNFRRSIGGGKPKTLINLVRQSKNVGLDKIIDCYICDQVNSQSLKTFTRVAYNCISYNLKERPTMDRIIKEIEKALELHLVNFRIPLEEIKLGTNNFSKENYLGGGGFGKVYRGTLSESRPIRAAAIKRLNPTRGQGKQEFIKELLLLSGCHHQNIIAFIGYCDEDDEMIMAFEYASHNSLDQYLRDSNKMGCITWVQRLKMCIGSARGLNHLHSVLGPNNRIIHRKIKSGNILFDDKWIAKISVFSPKEQLITQLNNMAVGIDFHCDPHDCTWNILTNEYDVYSFGVVLFQVLCGRLVFPKKLKQDENDDSETLIELIRCHKDNIHMMIDPCISDHIDSKCLDMFTGITCMCLEPENKKRPTMAIVLEKLEEALSIQENLELVYREKVLPRNCKEIIRRSDQPVVYTTKQQLDFLLYAGILIDGGKKWFSLSKVNKKNCVMISAIELFDENDKRIIGWESFPNSRFSHVACFKNANRGLVHKKAMHVTATMLSLESTYAVFLICKYTGNEHKAHTVSSPPNIYFKLLYGENDIYPSSAMWNDEEWMEVELFMFTNHMEVANFELHLCWIKHLNYGLYIEGIEFRPIEMASKEDETKVKEHIGQDTIWEKKISNDYEEVISRSTNVLQYSTKEELFSLLLRGILIDDNSMWFQLNLSNGKKIVMLSATCLMIKHIDGIENKITKGHPISRFPTTLKISGWPSLEIEAKIKAHILSPNTLYEAWLVYQSHIPTNLTLASLTLGNKKKKTKGVYLDHWSTTILPMNDPKYLKDKCIVSSSVKLDKRLTKRDDDWKEVELFSFFNDMDTHDEVAVDLHLKSSVLSNFIHIEGIEFRPQ